MRVQEYLDFVVRVDRGEGETYPVRVLDSPAGSASARMQLPVGSGEWQSRLSIVADARGGKLRGPNGDWAEADEFGMRYAQKLGEDLFAVLMSGEVLKCYEASLEQARARDLGLRIRLRIEAPELANLPWEYLIDGSQKPLTLSKETPIVRQLETVTKVDKLKLPPPVRILGMIGHHENLDVAAERQSIEEAIEHPLFNGTMKLDWVEGHRWENLVAALKKKNYQVFHFIGHGIFDRESETGKLLLEGDGGKSHAVEAGELGELLAGQKSLRVVVLNSCEGAKSSQANLFSSTAAILASHGLPAIVSMQYEISDRAALEFSRGFYNSLSDGNPVEEAVFAARNSIQIVLGATVEWATPVLNLRTADGLLFEVDVAGALGLQQKAPVERVLAAEPVTGSLARLAANVKEYWIDSVLKHKLERGARLELRAGEVMSAYGVEESGEARSPQELFRERGSLLILGDPGAGKTVALLELARVLLEHAESVPVVYNLSSWGAQKGSLVDWMVDELSGKYLIPKSQAREWIEQRKLIALLDGLHEVAAEAREDCVAAINDWLGSEYRSAVVVCCRTKEYCDLPRKLALNAAVRLRTLTRDEVLTFVAHGGEPLAALRGLLVRDSGLLIDARSPLMLGLMVEAYQGLKPEAAELRSERGIEARREMVMAAYVDRELRRAREGGFLV